MWPILSSHRSEIVSQKWEITGMKSFCSSATAPVIVITAMVVVEINTDKALTSICSKHLINVMFSWILWADLWEICYIYSYFTKEKIWDNYNKQSLGIKSKGTISNHLHTLTRLLFLFLKCLARSHPRVDHSPSKELPSLKTVSSSKAWARKWSSLP